MTNTKKILIIEDETALLRVLSDKLKREGYEVAEAKDGNEGLEQAITQAPHLILLDIVMPTMDGLTVIKKLRANKKTEDVPVIVISNLSEVEKISEILGTKKGVIEYLVKSHWSMSDVVSKVKQTLQIYDMLSQ